MEVTMVIILSRGWVCHWEDLLQGWVLYYGLEVFTLERLIRLYTWDEFIHCWVSYSSLVMSSYNFSLLLAHIQWKLSNVQKCIEDSIDAEAPILRPPDRKNWPTGKDPDAGKVQFSSPQSLSRVRLFVTPWTVAHQASPSITNPQSLLKLMFITSLMPSNHLTLHRPLLLLPSIFPSIRVFSSELVLPIRWPEYWSFSFSISPSNEHAGLISFRID